MGSVIEVSVPNKDAPTHRGLSFALFRMNERKSGKQLL